jgi:hypothetical protein
VLAEVAAARRRFPVADPTHEAAIGYVLCTEPLIAAGFARTQVLHFGAIRGTNALAGVTRLHVIGRPFPPPAELGYLAQVIHHDGPPVDQQLVLSPRRYGGQHFGMAVVDFADPRLAELLRAQRDDELLQTIHRARITAVEPQLRLDEAGTTSQPTVHVIVHTGHVIPGLRVDELVLTVPRTDTNTERAAEAETRIQAVLASAARTGEVLSLNEIGRRAGANHHTVAKLLAARANPAATAAASTEAKSTAASAAGAANGEAFGTPRHTLQSESLDRYAAGSQTGTATHEPESAAPSAIAPRPATATAPPEPDANGRVPCRGCGVVMVYPDQQCGPCADAAVQHMVAARQRRRFPARERANPRDGP